ncbi:MAG: isopenicillin N synthase family oxygenase [Gammaproteobacteria bacterium]|jgi:isopenicillin N synthase-like dioxygenase|nr:isopenicillin N synthase family oxygenase [Gammaproteobacteria bacterium]
MSVAIPIVDLSEFQQHKREFAKQLGQQYQQFGFVGFVNHGIDDELLNNARRVFTDFFALDKAVKEQYEKPEIARVRGYTGFGVEQAKGFTQPDLKELWHIGREMSDDNPYPDVLLPNLWPNEAPAMREHGYALFQALEAVGQKILAALALYLDLDEDWFVDKTDHGTSILRALHYPPIIDAEPGQVRAAQHEDINLITLLVGSEQAGLEILSRSGEWIPITTIEGTIVVNIGDMLQRLSNHCLPSTTHRVVNPDGQAAQQSRYSMPFFMHLNPEFVLQTLPSCIDEQHPNRYQPISAYDYLMERLREIKLT